MKGKSFPMHVDDGISSIFVVHSHTAHHPVLCMIEKPCWVSSRVYWTRIVFISNEIDSVYFIKSVHLTVYIISHYLNYVTC
jgi:hypothetical protein